MAATPAAVAAAAATSVAEDVVPVRQGRLTTAYDVQKAVGKGGYAIVYKAIRLEDGRVVAVKKVEIFEMSAKKRERCLSEVTLLHKLDHPNIIQMLDAFIDENMLIIIFEWAPAGDLKRLIKKTAESGRALEEGAIWTFFFQIVDGLRYMHSMRIMHRDIKPANVLVGANGALKLADLGLGRQLSEQTMEAFSKVGTPYYVSPEVVRGAGYDWKSDVWSMGCLLYELACLRSPFEMQGANLYDVFQRISKCDFTPLPADHFSVPLRHLVARMLQMDPAKRPELEEVWCIAKHICDAQRQSRQDVYSVSESIHSTLVSLGVEVGRRCAAAEAASTVAVAPILDSNGRIRSGRPRSRQNPAQQGTDTGSSSSSCGSGNSGGSRGSGSGGSSKGGSTQGALSLPCCSTLRLLHPLYFAEGLRGRLGLDKDNLQKQQLGAFMHIFAWLLRLSGNPDPASAIESNLEFLPGMRPPSSCAPRTPSRSSQHSSGGSRGRRLTTPTTPTTTPTTTSDRNFTTPSTNQHSSSGHTTTNQPSDQHSSGSGGGGRPRSRGSSSSSGNGTSGLQPTPPPQPPAAAPPPAIPVAIHVLKGAESVKKAAAAAGLATDFAPLLAVASGHGRAVCGLLQDMLALALAKVPVKFGQVHRQKDAAAAELEDIEEAELTGPPETLMSYVTPPSHRGSGGRSIEAEDEEDEEAYFDHSSSSHVQHRPPASAAPNQAASHETQGQPRPAEAGSVGGFGRYGCSGGCSGGSGVDPTAWRLEAERLAPDLSRIIIKGGDAAGGWTDRWHKLRQNLAGLRAVAPSGTAAVAECGAEVAAQLDGIRSKEARLNISVADILASYATARARLDELRTERQHHDQLLQLGHAAMHQLNTKIEAVTLQIQERAAALDGALPVRCMRDAIAALRGEMKGMDVRLGVARCRVTKHQAERRLLLAQQQQGAMEGEDGGVS
ncbi:MAG: hypothetical protein WDW36_002522 [Sanguina aurantia]